MIDKEQILAALKKLGPSSPTTIANTMNAEPGVIGYHLRNLLAAKAVKAAGASNSRVYALPDQDLAGAKTASQRRKAKKAAKRAAPQPRAPLPRPAAALFLPAFTEDSRLVIVHDAGHTLYTPEQTQSLADLLLNHFEA